MKSLRDSVYILVAVGSLAMAVCQPSEAGAEQAGQAALAAATHASNAMKPASDRSTH